MTYFQRKTTASQNWQKLSKLLPCRSYFGSCCIEIPTTLSNEVTTVIERLDFFDFFTIDMNKVDVWDGQCLRYFTSALLTLKSGLCFRGTLTFKQRLCTQKPQTRHLIELNLTRSLHKPQGNLLASNGSAAMVYLP